MGLFKWVITKEPRHPEKFLAQKRYVYRNNAYVPLSTFPCLILFRPLLVPFLPVDSLGRLFVVVFAIVPTVVRFYLVFSPFIRSF